MLSKKQWVIVGAIFLVWAVLTPVPSDFAEFSGHYGGIAVVSFTVVWAGGYLVDRVLPKRDDSVASAAES